MAVTKRTRFEVLKRDRYTCRYCRSQEQALTVDHVVPVSLGGSDAPMNLVACCRACNSGKSSSSPDAATVADVDQKALQWAAAMTRAADAMVAETESFTKILARFETAWVGGRLGTLPEDWEGSVIGFQRAGLPAELILDSMDVAARKRVSARERFKYFAGVCWTRIRELQDRASESLGVEAAPPRTCGHCDTCLDEETLEQCEIYYEPGPDEDAYSCEVCKRSDCMYDLGIQVGMSMEWQHNAAAIKHYRKCPTREA